MPVIESVNDVQPAAIGEGVMICGRCVENDHMNPPDVARAMLEAIVRRDDGPIDALLAAL
jgi:hypothetical protein